LRVSSQFGSGVQRLRCQSSATPTRSVGAIPLSLIKLDQGSPTSRVAMPSKIELYPLREELRTCSLHCSDKHALLLKARVAPSCRLVPGYMLSTVLTRQSVRRHLILASDNRALYQICTKAQHKNSGDFTVTDDTGLAFSCFITTCALLFSARPDVLSDDLHCKSFRASRGLSIKGKALGGLIRLILATLGALTT
jgi:hypothetical protein